MMKHRFGKCGYDWIMCKCGEKFRDNKDSDAKNKFANHLKGEGIDIAIILITLDTITRRPIRNSKQIRKGEKK